jgi:MFS family permease
MSIRSAPRDSHLTLTLSTVLHAFTHAYTVMLVPLYLLIRQDLHLPGVNSAALIVTVYLLVYTSCSYPAGVLADRLDRKWMLGAGLIGNGLMIFLMGFTHSYLLLLILGGMAGLFGTLFHPSANALVPEHYPKAPGMAMGLLSMGAGLGFFVGSQYAGWRAQTATWQLPGLRIAGWQHPCIEMGLFGMVVGAVFLVPARETRRGRGGLRDEGSGMREEAGERKPLNPLPTHPPLGRDLRRKIIAMAAVLGCRDFAGVGLLTLGSIYLQKAHGMDAKQVGFILGAMMLIGVVVNPIAVWLSGGRRRLWALAGILVGGGAVLATIPHWPVRWVLAALCLFEALQLGSYAVNDAALYERIEPVFRGRVAGLFLTIAGTFSATSPWILSAWTDGMGQRALHAGAYALPFAVLGAMMAFAALGAPLIARVGPLPAQVEPLPVPALPAEVLA